MRGGERKTEGVRKTRGREKEIERKKERECVCVRQSFEACVKNAY